ncbi:kinetochore protein Spc25-like [Pomacea canaliculata]|uniref:kinetochore protein Spc25-like n=1 Tax=Pomacea canaliculata TaxID=400727 RepID=UPI000D72E16E|nr:kinetochore protein Spc25-like [Pomacea canaliculata]XP_025096564.1 kinetochore protein Spc25-like [Pomacea canaliculata]XP_025096565.1 kinetochore protein Spc25-like [Pomacea canaliculata]
MNIIEEIPQLKSMLSQALEKVDKWTTEDKQTGVIRKHIIAEIENENNQRELLDKASQLKKLQAKLAGLNGKMNCQLHEKNLMIQELEYATQSINNEQESLSEQEQVVEKKLKEFTYGAELFRDRLGLTFKKTHGNRLQVVFTCIDHKDPDSPFYFYVQVEDGKYIISDCEPLVPDLDSLVEKLNRTNNLRSFMVAVRKRFKKMTEQ